MQTGVGPASPEGNVFRSPFPDVVVPDASFTEFVLARAGELGEKPALIDGPSGRVISYAGPRLRGAAWLSPVRQGYGMTEASPVTHMSDLALVKPGAIGPPPRTPNA